MAWNSTPFWNQQDSLDEGPPRPGSYTGRVGAPPPGSALGQRPWRGMIGEPEWSSSAQDPGGVPSGRSYLDKNRAQERYDRIQDRAMRRSMGGSYGGGGGGGRMAGAMPIQQPMQTMQPMRPFGQLPSPIHRGASFAPMRSMQIGMPTQLSDMAAINYGATPSRGQEYAANQARIQSGMGNVGDFAMDARFSNPSLSDNYNQAIARQRYRQYLTMQNPTGLVGQSQAALYGV